MFSKCFASELWCSVHKRRHCPIWFGIVSFWISSIILLCFLFLLSYLLLPRMGLFWCSFSPFPSSFKYQPYYFAWDVDSYCAHNLNFYFLYHFLSTSSSVWSFVRSFVCLGSVCQNAWKLYSTSRKSTRYTVRIYHKTQDKKRQDKTIQEIIYDCE